jgi:hypothetical protein
LSLRRWHGESPAELRENGDRTHAKCQSQKDKKGQKLGF